MPHDAAIQPPDLRAHLLRGATPFRSQPVTLPDGSVVIVREPTFRQRSDIYSAALKSGGKEIDVGKLNILALIHLCRSPDGTQVFGLADKDVLEALPVSDPLISTVAPVCVSMFNPAGEGGNGVPQTPPSSSPA